MKPRTIILADTCLNLSGVVRGAGIAAETAVIAIGCCIDSERQD